MSDRLDDVATQTTSCSPLVSHGALSQTHGVKEEQGVTCQAPPDGPLHHMTCSPASRESAFAVSYTHLRAHETRRHL
eukprot:2785183-Prorocentrum_lima.AAC.1